MLRWMGQRRKVNDVTEQATTITSIQEVPQIPGADITDPMGPLTTNISTGQRNGEPAMYAMKRSVYLPRVALKTSPGDNNSQPSPTINEKSSDKEFSSRPEESVSSIKRGDRKQGFMANGWADNFYMRSDSRFGGVNPLFVDNYKTRQSTPTGEKSSSSGYGGSNVYSAVSDQLYTEMKSKIDGVLEQNPNYVKSIQVAKRKNKSTHSSGSSGTLSTIPEGRIDFTIPRPIWPNRNQRHSPSNPEYDSLVDEAVLLYTSLSNQEANKDAPESIRTEVSVKEILLELFHNVNATMEGKGALSPEEMLKRVNEKIADSIDALKHATEEEMRLLCVNLRNSKKVDSVVRAFSHSSSSGHSSQGSIEHTWSNRGRTMSSDAEDIYQLASSSSSGFSDCMFNKDGLTVINNTNSLAGGGLDVRQLPMFVHDDLASVPNGVRNAMIYGTLCRNSSGSVRDKQALCGGSGHGTMGTTTGVVVVPRGGDKDLVEVKRSLLRVDDDKPSVWEQYYGVNMSAGLVDDGVDDEGRLDAKNGVNYVPKPTDVPIFPGGRPEADFTLDVPRSEMLSKRMKEDKKWRCRCRLLTSFLGFVFFLLSVMAVSLILTRGKKMFGSMV